MLKNLWFAFTVVPSVSLLLSLQGDHVCTEAGDRLVHILICDLELWSYGFDGDPLEGPPPTPAGIPHSHQCTSGEGLQGASISSTEGFPFHICSVCTYVIHDD